MTGSYQLWCDTLFVLVSMVTSEQLENTYLARQVNILFIQNYGQDLTL